MGIKYPIEIVLYQALSLEKPFHPKSCQFDTQMCDIETKCWYIDRILSSSYNSFFQSKYTIHTNIQ